MDKKIIIIHKICFAVSIFMLSASLLYYLFRWNSFPEEIGVHFGPDGEYDVIASKVYGFYPHVVGGIFLAGLAFSNFLVHKKSVGLRISEKGEKLFKTELSLTLDSLSFLVSLFFANWSRTVSLQTALNLDFVESLIRLMLACSGIGIIAQVITCQKFKLKQESAESFQSFHRISRLLSWILTAGGAGILLFCWGRYPNNEELYMNPEYQGLAYFANFDAYLDKHLLFIPQIMIFILLIIFEILSAKALKSSRTAFVSLTDKLKMLNAVCFFWWNFILEIGLKIGMISVSLFLILNILFILQYFRKISKECE